MVSRGNETGKTEGFIGFYGFVEESVLFMLGLLIATVITVITGYLIVKRYKAQSVLMIAGLLLMFCSLFIGDKPILAEKAATGFAGFDLFKYITTLFQSRTANLGMIIMSVAGFTRYMDKIGASKALVKLCIKPLQFFKAPYVVLGLGYIVGQILNVFIPSASGLGLLLMVTMFPILTSLGVSREAATAMIATASCLDLGPGSGNATLAAKNAGLDVAIYFASYQIPIAICVMIVVAVSHALVQKYFDRKAGHKGERTEFVQETETSGIFGLIYAFLPVLPLVLILTFSKLVISSIKMDVITAMILSIFVSMFFELLRTRDLKEVLKSIQVFFDGMGTQFATVVTLIVAGEVFAKGLTSIGAIDTIIGYAQTSGFGGYGMTIVMTMVIVVSSIVMGSGNAPFFAFAALAPAVAEKVGIASVLMLLPMQFAAGIARNVSPITAVVVAVAGIAQISPVEIVKRSAIPMFLALITTVVTTFLFLH